MNGVAMDHHELILCHNGATDSRKVSRCLPDLREPLKNSKIARPTQNIRNSLFPYILIYNLPVGSAAWAQPY